MLRHAASPPGAISNQTADLVRAIRRSNGMHRIVLAAGLVALTGALLAPIGLLGAAQGEARRGESGSPALYGVTWQGSLTLARVDRATLRPLPGRRVPLSGEPLGWSFSPDRSRLAVGSTARGARLRLVDLRAMQTLGEVRIARRGSGVATTWAGPTRVLAVVVTPGCCGAGDTSVIGVDSVSQSVLWRRTLGGSLQAGERSGDGLVLVLGPRGRAIGPSRLVHVGGDGEIRSASLPEIRSGTESRGSVTHSWNPGLAVDRTGGRAFVVQARAPLAEVDLRSFVVRSHPLGAQPRAADALAGPMREALWLGHGTLAVTGSDSGPSRQTAAGLTLIDTRRWSARTINRRTSDAVLVAGRLLASSFLFDARGQPTAGSGLTGYSLDGTRRFHRYGSQPITGVQPLGRRALVGAQAAISLIDARSGRPLQRFRRFAMSLLDGDAPVGY
jgi:hypothetical protein